MSSVLSYTQKNIESRTHDSSKAFICFYFVTFGTILTACVDENDRMHADDDDKDGQIPARRPMESSPRGDVIKGIHSHHHL